MKISVHQVDAQGRKTDFPITPDREGARAARDQEANQSQRTNIALKGTAKHPSVSSVPPPHSGMHSRTRDGMHVQGQTQTTLMSGSGPTPATPLVEKRLSAPAITPGFKNQTSALGRAMLAAGSKK